MTWVHPDEVLAFGRWQRLSGVIGRCVVDAVDLAGVDRAAATRARTRQATARIGAALHAMPALRCAILLAWTGGAAAMPRVREAARSQAEAMHRSAERTRGAPLGMALVFVDERAPHARVRSRLHQDSALVPDGVAAVGWGVACAHGIREAAIASRL